MKINLTTDTRLTIPPQVMSRLVEDETVLLDLARGIYFGLDGVGKLIWESVEGNNLGQVAAIVAAEYEIDEARAKTDVFQFADELLENGLLEMR